MARVKINREKCKGCMLCVSVCPKGLIKQDTKLSKRGIKPVIFAGDGCSGCASCVLICPDAAIEAEALT